MGIKFCKELSDEELIEYNKKPKCNTKITQNKDNEICYYKNPRVLSFNIRSINIFYIDYHVNDSLVKIIDYIYEYMYFNNLNNNNNNVLVKIFVKWDEPVSSSKLLKQCDVLSENISSYIQIPCIIINIFGNNEIQPKILFHIVEDEFSYRVTRGVIITNNDDSYSHHISNKFRVLNLNDSQYLQSDDFYHQFSNHTPLNISPQLGRGYYNNNHLENEV